MAVVQVLKFLALLSLGSCSLYFINFGWNLLNPHHIENDVLLAIQKIQKSVQYLSQQEDDMKQILDHLSNGDMQKWKDNLDLLQRLGKI